MPRIHPSHRSTMAALLVAALAVAAPAAAKSPVLAKPVPIPAAPVPADPTPLEFYGLEDQILEIALDGASGAVVATPTHGTLVLDASPPLYVPHADFNGVDSFALEVGDTTREVLVKIVPVNDAPAFVGGGDRLHLAAGPVQVKVAGWASGITAGPGNESASQSVRFEFEPTQFDNRSVAAIAVDADGTLRYSLTGQPGVSEFHLRAVDDGGTAAGGIDRSAPTVLRIGVGAVADLSIHMVRPAGPILPGRSTYQWVVGNAGPSDAVGVRVSEVLPPDAGSTKWRCIASRAATCPKEFRGTGAISGLIDLPAGATVVFDVTGMRAPPGTGLHAAFVEPPKSVVDPDLGNNEAVD